MLVRHPIYSVSRMRLEVPEAMEEALKATSRTRWIRNDLALSVEADTTEGRTIVSTSVGITPRTAGTRIGRRTDLKKECPMPPRRCYWREGGEESGNSRSCSR